MTSLTLAYPWLLAVLPLPLLVWWFIPPYGSARRGLVVPFLPRLAILIGEHPGRGASISRGSMGRWLIVLICWLAVVVALTRPQVIEAPITREIPTRDLLLAVDLSGSMETRDFDNGSGDTVDRLTAVKGVLDEFLARRQGDRVGLIFFGSAAFVQAPFTEDLDVCRALLDEAQVRMAGPQTAFGDALGLAITVFDSSTVQDRVLIALTDGNDTSSQVPPEKAAQIAADRGIVIHTVAVGDPEAAGEDALDETTLRRVATATGGLYSHAGNGQELAAIYDQLDALETRKVDTLSYRPRRDVFWWPLVAALAISVVFLGIRLVAGIATRHPQTRAAATLSSIAPMGLTVAPSTIHLLRPAWLLTLIPLAALWWLLRHRSDTAQAWRGLVAPHLLEHLLGGEERRSRFGPLEGIGMIWLLTVLAIAGPSWEPEPSPFAADAAALAIVIRVAPSMQTEDLQPSRLERATLKIQDLLKARGNAQAALVAYAGTAHRVMPVTRDGSIIGTFAQALEPDIMPTDGDVAAAALQLADRTLAAAGGGSIVWITDSVAPEQSAALAEWRSSSPTRVRLWPPLLPGDELDTLVDNARPADPSVTRLTADDSDVRSIVSAAQFVPATDRDAYSRPADGGYWFIPVIAALMLTFFRRGWMIQLGRTL